jgi:dTDP-D-glucose 4,6-dehydratase
VASKLSLGRSPCAGKVYSIGSDDCFSNLDVARRLLKAFGLDDKESEYLEHVEDRLFNDLRYYIDTSETEKLGWKPEVTFEDGLAKTST